MKLRKQYIPLLLFAALVIGFLGAYAGVKLAEPTSSTEQAPVVNGDKQNNASGFETSENMEKVVRAYQIPFYFFKILIFNEMIGPNDFHQKIWRKSFGPIISLKMSILKK